MKKRILTVLFLTIFATQLLALVQAPQLKWKNAGGGPYIMNGSYSGSPAVADLNHDGKPEVIWANYMVYVVDGATGNTIWNAHTGHDRDYTGRENIGWTFPGVAVADLDGDGELEIVTAHNHGWVAIYNRHGHFYNHAWPKQLCPQSDIRSLVVADLNHDGMAEILLGTTRQGGEAEHDWYVLTLDGQNYGNWPHTAKHHCSHGAFNQNMTVCDLDRDGLEEVIAMADVFYVHAFSHEGQHLIASPVYNGNKWADIPLWLTHESELRMWGADGEYIPKFSFSPLITADVNQDSEPEIIVVAYIHDRTTRPGTPLYHTPVILNTDRTRFHADGFDWRELPVPADLAANVPLTEDWRISTVCMPNPVAADLDNDGFSEIIFPSNDGLVHAYWLDKTEHHNWPFHVTETRESLIRFATEPAVVDVDNDGYPEVIFGSWTPRNANANGKLHVLDYRGNVLHEISVPEGSETWNGITSAPTIANIDENAELEIVVGTAWSGICAYDLPGSANARVLWGTGQANFKRTGNVGIQAASVEQEPATSPPVNFSLKQNFPNPFVERTMLALRLQKNEYVQLQVYDIQGRLVTDLYRGDLMAGSHQFAFTPPNDNPELANGIYFAKIQVGVHSQVIKMTHLR